MDTDSAPAFRALADPVRRQILVRLRSGGRSVQELASEFPISRPAVSKHLRILREGGLVTEHREGRHRIYELVASSVGRARRWLAALESTEPRARPRVARQVVARRRPEPGRPKDGTEDASKRRPSDPADAEWRSW